MISRWNVLWMLTLLVWLPTGVHAAGPAAGPLQSLQQQVERLTRQYEAIRTRFTPPALSTEVGCTGSVATLHLTISGTKEIAYYAVQEHVGESYANIVIFVDPGQMTATAAFDVDAGGTTRTFLLVAGDTDGNVARAVVAVPPGACLGPCPPDAICP